MARKPNNVSWFGFNDVQGKLLDRIDFYGNNGWARNSQSDALMPIILTEVADAGMTIEQVTQAMASIGYSWRALHQLERWESKRLTGRFGK
jgi:hypothetical protein